MVSAAVPPVPHGLYERARMLGRSTRRAQTVCHIVTGAPQRPLSGDGVGVQECPVDIENLEGLWVQDGDRVIDAVEQRAVERAFLRQLELRLLQRRFQLRAP